MIDTSRWVVSLCGLQASTRRPSPSGMNQNQSEWIISWEELHEDKKPATGSGPHHRGCIFLGLLVSGLQGLNLLDALSAIIAERAQGRGADVTFSAGWRLGNYVGQLLDCLGLRKTRGEGKRSGGGGGWPEASAGMRGRAGVATQGGFYATVVRGRVQWGITMRVSRSSRIDKRESSVRWYSTGQYAQ